MKCVNKTYSRLYTFSVEFHIEAKPARVGLKNRLPPSREISCPICKVGFMLWINGLFGDEMPVIMIWRLRLPPGDPGQDRNAGKYAVAEKSLVIADGAVIGSVLKRGENI